MKVLIACEFSGIVRDAFIKKGHDAWSCDLLPTEKPGPHIQKDAYRVALWEGPWDLMIAHPPCTYLACSGNKWFNPEYKKRFPDRPQQRYDALCFADKLLNRCDIKKICLENPIGYLNTHLRKPDQIIQPYQFGHADRKSTCLWLKGLPLLKATKIVEPNIKRNRNGKTASVNHDYALHLPAEERWKFRSRTYQGIADAMADQWG